MAMEYRSRRVLAAALFYFLIVFPCLAMAECTCDLDEDEDDKKKATKLKIAALFSILAAGAVGVVLPALGRAIPSLRPESDVFFVIKAFAAGVILATGLIHVLPDAFKSLTSPCLKENPWGKFPFAGFIAMVAVIVTLTVEAQATGYYTRSQSGGDVRQIKSGDEETTGAGDHAVPVHTHTHATHGHTHGPFAPPEVSPKAELIRHRVISQVLELGIVVHSVIIGISLGASQSTKTIRTLAAALSFHQFFEGMGLGGCIAQAKFKVTKMAIMSTFFALTTPIGVAIGMAIASKYDENSEKALIVQGVFNSASSGILIYMSIVDLLASDFMNPRMQNNGKLQLWSNAALLLGSGCMALMAKWA